MSVFHWHLWLHHGQVLGLYLQCSLHGSGLSSCPAWSFWGEQEHGQGMEGSEEALSLDPKLSAWCQSGDELSLWSMSYSIQKVLRARLKQQPRGDTPFLGSLPGGRGQVAAGSKSRLWGRHLSPGRAPPSEQINLWALSDTEFWPLPWLQCQTCTSDSHG